MKNFFRRLFGAADSIPRAITVKDAALSVPTGENTTLELLIPEVKPTWNDRLLEIAEKVNRDRVSEAISDLKEACEAQASKGMYEATVVVNGFSKAEKASIKEHFRDQGVKCSDWSYAHDKYIKAKWYPQ